MANKIDSELSKRIKLYGLVFTLIMVLYHSGDAWENIPINDIDSIFNTMLYDLFGMLGVLAMYYFFFVTGFLLYVGTDIKSYTKKIKNRFFSLFIPYILWNIIYEFLPFQTRFSFSEWWRSMFLLESYPPDAPLWYLYSVFVLAIISPIFYVLFKRKKIETGILILLFICTINNIILNISNETIFSITHKGNIYLTLVYLPAFLIGLFWGINYSNIDKSQLFKIMGFLVLGAKIFEIFREGFFLSICCALIPLLLLNIQINIINTKRLSFFSNLSFMIYAMHACITGRLQRIIRVHFLLKICPYVSVSNILGRLILLPVVFVVVLVFWYVTSKILPNILTVISGGRCKKYEDIFNKEIK